MKVVNNARKLTARVDNMEPGSCFFHSGNPYVLCQRKLDDVCFYAVRLSDGFLGRFKSDTIVTLVDAVVTIA